MLAATAILLAATLCYVCLCAASPFGNCRKCRGFGFKTRTDRRGRLKRGRDCRRCRGLGKRIRTGRWLFNRTVAFYRDAHPDTPAAGTRPGGPTREGAPRQ